MKNKSVKYILLSVAIISSLLFTACGKKSEPVNEALETTAVEETTTQDETDPTITDSERGTMEELSVEIKDNSTQENTSSVDSTGVDIKLTAEDGEYKEPTAEELEAQSVPETPIVEEYSQYSKETQTALDNAKRMYEKGSFTETEYKDLVELAISQDPSNKPSSSSGGSSTYEFTPEQQAAHDAMVTTGQGDQRTNIQYGQGDYTGLEGYRIN